MNGSADVHREAMAVADQAQFEFDRGNGAIARELFGKALDLEIAAVDRLKDDAPALERAVLLRSAAALALEANQNGVAERLLARGLLEDAPSEILNEMRDLLEQVHFQRHLELRGLVLEDTDVQMSISGHATGYGFASSDEFVSRVNDFERLLYRTAERRAGRPYREGGSPKKRIKESFEVYLSVPRAASFAVTLRLGRPKDQLAMTEVEGQPNVIAETLDLLELTQRKDWADLEDRIPEEGYRRNFVALAKKLAPDGSNVSVVGFTTRRGNEERRVSLTKTRSELKRFRVAGPVMPAESVEVRGLLKFADDTSKGEGRIKLVDSANEVYVIAVPEGMMTDIVKPLWDDEVVVRGEKVGAIIHLEEIEPSS